MPRAVGSPGGRLGAVVTTTIVALGGCSGNSALNPKGYGARQVTTLWWWLFWVSLAVWVIVMLFVGWALLRRQRRDVTVRGGDARGFVAITGIVAPLVVLVGVYAVSLRTQVALGSFPGGRDAVELEVVGHRWWWQARYPATGAVTANEIHIPVGETVRVRLTTADVIHSFWVPQLAPKTDTVAGQVNTAWLRADRAGRYPGRCAEYCGLEHAMMDFLVVAEPAEEYRAWLRRVSGPARSPSTPQEREGLRVFETSDCAACHAISGTRARGRVGPDLTTIGSRWSIGAGAVPNTIGDLGGWISNARTLKPGNAMPPQPLAAADLQALLAYLVSLK